MIKKLTLKGTPEVRYNSIRYIERGDSANSISITKDGKLICDIERANKVTDVDRVYFFRYDTFLVVTNDQKYIYFGENAQTLNANFAFATGKEITAIEHDNLRIYALFKDGSVICSGFGNDIDSEVRTWSGVKKLLSAYGIIIGIKEDRTVHISGVDIRKSIIIKGWNDIVNVYIKKDIIYALDEKGTIFSTVKKDPVVTDTIDFGISEMWLENLPNNVFVLYAHRKDGTVSTYCDNPEYQEKMSVCEGVKKLVKFEYNTCSGHYFVLLKEKLSPCVEGVSDDSIKSFIKSINELKPIDIITDTSVDPWVISVLGKNGYLYKVNNRGSWGDMIIKKDSIEKVDEGVTKIDYLGNGVIQYTTDKIVAATTKEKEEKKERTGRQRAEKLRAKSETEKILTTENGVQKLLYLTQSDAKKEWKFKSVAGGFAVTAYLGKEKDILIPSEIAGKPVVSIGTGSYYGTIMDTFNNVVKITIPYGVKEINGDAFDSCESLEYVSIPDTVTKIGKYAFGSCTSLKTIDIPQSVVRIESRAFAESGLTEITIPASAEELGDWIFGDCESLIKIEFEEGFDGYIIQPQTIVDGCTSLSYISLPSPNLNEISFDTHHIKKAVLGQDVNIDLWIPYTTVDEMEFPHGSNIYDIIDGCVYTKDHKKIVFRTSNR